MKTSLICAAFLLASPAALAAQRINDGDRYVITTWPDADNDWKGYRRTLAFQLSDYGYVQEAYQSFSWQSIGKGRICATVDTGMDIGEAWCFPLGQRSDSALYLKTVCYAGKDGYGSDRMQCHTKSYPATSKRVRP